MLLHFFLFPHSFLLELFWWDQVRHPTLKGTTLPWVSAPRLQELEVAAPAARPEEMWRAPSGSLPDRPQVMEPQNADHGLEGTLKNHLAPNSGDQVIQSLIQPGLEHFQMCLLNILPSQRNAFVISYIYQPPPKCANWKKKP